MKNIVMITVYVIGQLNYSNAASSRLDYRITTDDICPISKTTLEKVDRCPENNESIRERSERKNCAKYEPCQGHPLIYHCVRHENYLVEVCAPKEIIIGHCCAEYIKEVGRVLADYSMPCPECPFRYISSTALKYQTCTCHIYENGRSKRDAECNTKIEEATGKFEEEIEFEEETGKDPNRSSGNPMVGYIIVPIAVVMILLGGGLFVFWKKRKQLANVDRTSYKHTYGCEDPLEEAKLKKEEMIPVTDIDEVTICSPSPKMVISPYKWN